MVRSLLLLLVACMCLSCFEIREEITISKQGSGNYVFLLDMSRSKSLIDMAMSMQMAKDRTSFAQIDSAFAKGTERLAQIQGIQNVQAINDHEQYVFGMRFDFQHIEALNAALNQSQEQAELNGTNIFTFKKKELSRTERTPISALADLAVLRSTPEGAAQMQTLLQGAAYVCVVRPQTGKIRSFSNPNGELQDNNKTFYYRVPLLDIMEGRTSPANTIKFKF